MPPKPKKSSFLWKVCENCEASITSKDIEIHTANCPPDLNAWNHHFVYKAALYGSLEIKDTDDYNGLSSRYVEDYVFLSQSVMQLCGFMIGGFVLINMKDKTKWFAKRAWPCSEKSLTSVLVPQKVFHSLDLSCKPTNVVVSKLVVSIPLESITVKFVNQPDQDIAEDLKKFLQRKYVDKMLLVKDRYSIEFFGKNYKFDIEEIKPYCQTKNLEYDLSKLNIKDNEVPAIYKVLDNTNWFYTKEICEEDTYSITLENIGGLENVISELRDLLSFALGLYNNVQGLNLKAICGVLLYGHTGCGKTVLAKCVIQDSGAHLVEINGSEIFSKFFGATESALRSAFNDAKRSAPSVILLDEIDILCPARPGTEQERRVTSALLQCLDELHQDASTAGVGGTSRVAVIATTSRPDSLNHSVRRAGRLDTEIELPVPDAKGRLDILSKLVSRMPNQCTLETLNSISKATHGCTGADLAGLCSLASSQAVRRVADFTIFETNRVAESDTSDLPPVRDVLLTDADLQHAAAHTKPSAMREVAVEVPDVRWSDIGGQHDLKLKLKQAVEWPLTHPESFRRLGVTPPRGVLMYGPPGCSKTMIAKALASESGLNFLSVKGPELFSQFVGESERAVRDVFRRARRVAPSIVFFDEIDALGTSRGGAGAGQAAAGSNVQERVLAQLLTELDGVAPLGNVTVVAATNRPDRLDRALLRPGRLDRIVYVPLPDLETRREIFSITLSRMPASPEIKVDDLSLLTDGYSGAEVRAVCHEAAMIALEENIDANQITLEHFQAALVRVQPRTPKELLKLYEDYENQS